MSEHKDEALRQNVVMATYRVKAGCEASLCTLIGKHGPLLQSLDLVEDLPFQVFRRLFGDGRVMFVEIFTWKDDGAERAHDHLEIRELWQQMSECVAPHEGQPAMAFPHFSHCGCTP